VGRKPLPVELKVARGTDRKDRDGDPASRPKGAVLSVIPDPPECLNDIGRVRWEETCRRLQTMGVLEDRYLQSVEAYCLAYEALAAANAVIAEEGMYYIFGKNNAIAKHPAATEAKNSRDEIRRYQIEFGFTPSSASTVKSKAPNKTTVPNRTRA
jgi:P27 family predicted phage terminase small subunit